MRRLASLLAAATVLAVAGAAHAGGYLGLGIHSGAGLGGDMDAHFTSEGHNGGRVALGTRMGRLALEASLSGTDLTSTTNFGERIDYSTVSLGIDGKYFVPLAFTGALEAFGKLGMHRTWLTADQDTNLGHTGDSWAAGAGLQYSFSAGPIGGAAVLLDYTYQNLAMKDDGRRDLDGSVRTLSLGFQIGF